MVYLFLSHEYNQRIILSYSINENEIIPSLTRFFLHQIGWKEKFLICMV
jgi:NADH:ubiquinone oxidoreductase subunit C